MMSFIRKIKRKGRVYLAEVENKWIDGKVVQKFIRYIGVDPDSKRNFFPRCNEELELNDCRVIGPVLVLDYIAKKLDLHSLLGDHAPAILSLVYSHCCDYKGVANTSEWFQKTDLTKIFGVSKITEKMYHNSINTLEKIDQNAFEKSIFENIQNFCKKDDSGIVYDVTNTYFTGTRCNLAKPGHDKTNIRGRPLIQIGLGVTQKWGFPIFHQTHEGNVHDAKIFSDAIERFSDLGIDKGLVVIDRGITSKDNVLRLSSRNWKVLAGVPLHKGIKNIISKMDLSSLELYRYRIEQNETIFYVKSFPHKIGPINGRLLVLLDPKKKQRMKEERLRKITFIRKLLLNGESIGDDKFFKNFFNTKNGVNAHAVARAEKFDGLSFLFTNSRLSREKIVHQYFDKDIIEKAFEIEKGLLALRPIRFRLEQKVKGHVSICQLAYALLTTFRYMLKSQGLLLSVGSALKKLSTVYKIYYSNQIITEDGKPMFSKVIVLDKMQEFIIRAVSPNLLS